MAKTQDQADQTRQAQIDEAQIAEVTKLNAKFAVIDAWLNQWFPEGGDANVSPVPYLSGAWHHVRSAVDDLKDRLKDI